MKYEFAWFHQLPRRRCELHVQCECVSVCQRYIFKCTHAACWETYAIAIYKNTLPYAAHDFPIELTRVHTEADTRMRRYTDTATRPGDTDTCSPAGPASPISPASDATMPVMQSCIQSLRRHLAEKMGADRRAGSDCPKSFQVNNKWSIIIRHQTRRANIEYPFALFAFVFAFVFVFACLHCHWFIFLAWVFQFAAAEAAAASSWHVMSCRWCHSCGSLCGTNQLKYVPGIRRVRRIYGRRIRLRIRIQVQIQIPDLAIFQSNFFFCHSTGRLCSRPNGYLCLSCLWGIRIRLKVKRLPTCQLNWQLAKAGHTGRWKICVCMRMGPHICINLGIYTIYTVILLTG